MKDYNLSFMEKEQNYLKIIIKHKCHLKLCIILNENITLYAYGAPDKKGNQDNSEIILLIFQYILMRGHNLCSY